MQGPSPLLLRLAALRRTFTCCQGGAACRLGRQSAQEAASLCAAGRPIFARYQRHVDGSATGMSATSRCLVSALQQHEVPAAWKFCCNWPLRRLKGWLGSPEEPWGQGSQGLGFCRARSAGGRHGQRVADALAGARGCAVRARAQLRLPRAAREGGRRGGARSRLLVCWAVPSQPYYTFCQRNPELKHWCPNKN
jgi:hypothetical protein